MELPRRYADLGTQPILETVCKPSRGIVHNRPGIDLSQESCGSRLILRHNALGVIGAVPGDMRYRLINPINNFD